MKQKVYNVSVKVKVDTILEIKAASFEEALQKAAGYGVKDVVEFDTDYCDGEIEVTGVFK